MTMDDRVMTSLARPRTYALLLVGFAAFALAIAGVGLFGVLSYSVGPADAGNRRADSARRSGARHRAHGLPRRDLPSRALGVVTGLAMAAAVGAIAVDVSRSA